MDDRTLALIAPGARWSFATSTAMRTTVSDAWYSPSYGVRVPCRAVNYALRADVSAGLDVVFRIERAAAV